MDDYPAISVFCSSCDLRDHAVSRCFEARCCWAWQRRGHEDKEQSKERDRREREAKG